MLVKSNSNSNDKKDWLAIGLKEYRENNPYGYNDYKETYDKSGWWKTVEYTDENGERVDKQINPLGQVIIVEKVNNTDELYKKMEDCLDNNLDDYLDDWSFDDNQQNTEYRQSYDVEQTPDIKMNKKNLTEKDFYKMEWKETQYTLYKLLVDISSSLSNVKEVLTDGEKKYK